MGVTVTMRAEERGVAREEGGTGEVEEDAEEEEEEGAADTLVMFNVSHFSPAPYMLAYFVCFYFLK